MRRFKVFLLVTVLLFLCFCITSCSMFSGDDEYTRITDFTPHVFKYADGVTAYGYYDIGNCRKLTGDVYTLVVFLDDDVSSWDDESRNTFYNKRFFPSVNYISEQAKRRDVDLNLQSGQYITKSDLQNPPRYRGIVQPSADNAIENIDIFKQVAQTLGFPTSEVLHAYLKNYTKVEQIAYIIALNKPGRAYAVCDTTYNDIDSVEYVVAFSSNEQGTKAIGSSIIHELLHLFGAADLYDPKGEYPDRLMLCKKLYPKDIMMKSAVNPKRLTIGRLTECLIGWSDYFPVECDCPEWWRKNSVEPQHRE